MKKNSISSDGMTFCRYFDEAIENAMQIYEMVDSSKEENIQELIKKLRIDISEVSTVLDKYFKESEFKFRYDAFVVILKNELPKEYHEAVFDQPL